MAQGITSSEDLVKLASEEEMAMGRVHELVDGLRAIYQLEAEILQDSAGFREEISRVERDTCPDFGSPEIVPATSTDTQTVLV